MPLLTKKDILDELVEQEVLLKPESFNELDFIFSDFKWDVTLQNAVDHVCWCFVCEWDCSLHEWARKVQNGLQ